MKNSYRNFAVQGTSALKYELYPELRRSSNVVKFPGSGEIKVNVKTGLRVHRKKQEPDAKAKIDIAIAFVVGCAISYGSIFSMM